VAGLILALTVAPAARAEDARLLDLLGRPVVTTGPERFDGSRRILDDRGYSIGTIEPDRTAPPNEDVYWILNGVGRRVGQVELR